MPDPQWAIDAGRSEAEIWKSRAEEQLARARACEQRANKLDRELFDVQRLAVQSVGGTPTEAIQALAEMKKWGEVNLDSIIPMEIGESFDWCLSFRASHTGFKAAGRNVPGGVILTWWT